MVPSTHDDVSEPSVAPALRSYLPLLASDDTTLTCTKSSLAHTPIEENMAEILKES